MAKVLGCTIEHLIEEQFNTANKPALRLSAGFDLASWRHRRSFWESFGKFRILSHSSQIPHEYACLSRRFSIKNRICTKQATKRCSIRPRLVKLSTKKIGSSTPSVTSVAYSNNLASSMASAAASSLPKNLTLSRPTQQGHLSPGAPTPFCKVGVLAKSKQTCHNKNSPILLGIAHWCDIFSIFAMIKWISPMPIFKKEGKIIINKSPTFYLRG